MRDAGHRTPDAGHRTTDIGHRTAEKAKIIYPPPRGVDIIIFLSKTSWLMDYGEVPLFGPTSRTPLKPPPSSLLPSLPLSPLSSSLALVVLKIFHFYTHNF